MTILTRSGVILMSAITIFTGSNLPNGEEINGVTVPLTNETAIVEATETKENKSIVEEIIEIREVVKEGSKTTIEVDEEMKITMREEREKEKALIEEERLRKVEAEEKRIADEKAREAARPEEIKHTLVYGDTLNKLATQYNVNVLDIQYNNDGLYDVNTIVTGQEYLVGGKKFQHAPEGWVLPQPERIVEKEIAEVVVVSPVVEPEVAVQEVVSPIVETTPAPQPEPVQAPQSEGYQLTVTATGYSTQQPSLSSHTATGVNLLQNPWVIAIDPAYHNYGTSVDIPGYGTFTMNDSGGAIKGPNRIDIHFPTVEQALAFGVRTITITVYP